MLSCFATSDCMHEVLVGKRPANLNPFKDAKGLDQSRTGLIRPGQPWSYRDKPCLACRDLAKNLSGGAWQETALDANYWKDS